MNEEYKLICQCCKKWFPSREVQEHHVIPESIGGTDRDGRVNLCERCHSILHYTLLKIVWPYVKDKASATAAIKRYTESLIAKRK